MQIGHFSARSLRVSPNKDVGPLVQIEGIMKAQTYCDILERMLLISSPRTGCSRKTTTRSHQSWSTTFWGPITWIESSGRAKVRISTLSSTCRKNWTADFERDPSQKRPNWWPPFVKNDRKFRFKFWATWWNRCLAAVMQWLRRFD